MQTDVDELRTRLDALSAEFERAKETIRALEARRSSQLSFRQLVALGCAMAAAMAIGLSAQPGVTKFQAPFLVTDGAGKTIFAVMDAFPNARFGRRGALVLNESGEIVAGVMAIAGGGGVVKVAKEGKAAAIAVMAASTKGLGFQTLDGGNVTLDLSDVGSTVNAPFEVIDKNRKTVFKTNDTAN